MKIIYLPLTLFVTAGLSATACCAELGSSATWTTDRAASLNRTPNLTQATEALIIELDPETTDIRPTVGEARFVDLDHNGTLELVALVDYSGRLFFSTIVVITTHAGHPLVATYRSNGTNMHGLAKRLISQPESKTKLLVVDRFIDAYRGAVASPVEQRLLELKSGALHDVSRQHRHYYVTVRLPALEKQAGLYATGKDATIGVPSSTRAAESDKSMVLRQEIERARKQSLGE